MTRGVLLIGNYPPPYGGVPRVIENLAPFLAELGWHVHVLSMGRSGIERRPGVTVYKLPLAAKLPLVLRHAVGLRRAPLGIRVRNRKDLVTRAWFRVLASVGREIIRQHRIDVICGFNLSRGGLVGAALGQERGIPLVVNNFGELLSNEAFFRSNPWLLPFVVGQARRLVSGSRHCAESYRRFGLSPAVEVIPYGVDTARFRPTVDGDAVRRRMGAGPEEVVVLYLGRLVRDMGLHTLLAAAPALLGGAVPIRLVIAGAAGDLSADAHALAERSAGRVVVLEERAQRQAARAVRGLRLGGGAHHRRPGVQQPGRRGRLGDGTAGRRDPDRWHPGGRARRRDRRPHPPGRRPQPG